MNESQTEQITDLNTIQQEIYKAIIQMQEKSTFTEFAIAKKIRENTRFEGKKKAGLGLADLMTVCEKLQPQGIFYSIHINSVNECLLKKEEAPVDLPLEAKQRRQKSEKSMQIFTSGDFSGPKSNSSKKNKNSAHPKRSQRQKLSIYQDYGDD